MGPHTRCPPPPKAVFTAAAGGMEILSLHSVIPEFCHMTGIKTQVWFHDNTPDDSKIFVLCVQELLQANRTSVGKITHDKVLNAAKGEQRIPGSSEVASGDCSYAEGGRF